MQEYIHYQIDIRSLRSEESNRRRRLAHVQDLPERIRIIAK